MKGSDFAQQMLNVGGPARSAAALAQILAGNMPFFMSQFRQVSSQKIIDFGDGNGPLLYEMIYKTRPNYLGIGETPEDFITWPLTILDLQKYCDSTAQADSVTGAKLAQWFIPPAYLIRNTWLATECKIDGQFNGSGAGGAATSSTEEIIGEQIKINKAMLAQGCALTAFIRCKKAYNTAPNVTSANLHFSGWWNADGSGSKLGGRGVDAWGVQGHDATGDHPATYADYSHGCDLVSGEVFVNGRSMRFDQVCNHPKLCVLASDQGPFNPVFPNTGAGAPPAPPQLLASQIPQGIAVGGVTTAPGGGGGIGRRASFFPEGFATDNAPSATGPSYAAPLIVGAVSLAILWATLRHTGSASKKTRTPSHHG